MSMDSLKLNTRSEVIPVTLESEGKEEQFELREMNAKDRESYLDLVRSRMEFIPGREQPFMRKGETVQSNLISRCLFRKMPDGTWKKVTVDEAEKWPTHVNNAIYEAARSLSRLAEDAGELLKETKNASPASDETGSK